MVSAGRVCKVIPDGLQLSGDLACAQFQEADSNKEQRPTAKSDPRHTATECTHVAAVASFGVAAVASLTPPSGCASRKMDIGFFFIWLHSASEPSEDPVIHSVPVTYLRGHLPVSLLTQEARDSDPSFHPKIPGVHFVAGTPLLHLCGASVQLDDAAPSI